MYDDLTFVVPFRTDNGPRERIFNWTQDRLKKLFPDSPVIVCDNEGDFVLAAARNNGMRQVETEFVASIDGDTIWERDVIEDGLDALATDYPWVIPYTYYCALHGDAAERLLNEDPATQLWDYSGTPNLEYVVYTDPDQMFQPESGIVMMRTEDMLTTGGFDERCQTWGWEDRIFRLVADKMIGPHWRPEHNAVYHIWHPRGPEITVGHSKYQENWNLYNWHVDNFEAAHQRFL